MAERLVAGVAAVGDRVIELLAQRLDHRVGHAHLEVAGQVAHFQMEGGVDDDLVGRVGDVGELGLDLGTQVADLQRVHRLPGVLVGVDGELEQALDNALFGIGEFAPLGLGDETAVTAEQVVHHHEHQAGREHHQPGAAQRLHGDQVQVGGHRQIAREVLEALVAHRIHGDVRAAPDQVEQADPEMAREAFVDDVQAVQALADDPVLGRGVIGAQARLFAGRRLVVTAGPVEQRIDFFLG